MLYRLQSCLKYFAFLGLVPWTESCRPCQYFQKIYSLFLICTNLAIFFVEIEVPQKDSLLLSLLVSMIVFIAKITCMTVILLQLMCQYPGYYGYCEEFKRLRERLEVQLKMGALAYPRRRYIKIVVLGMASLGTMAIVIYTSFNARLIYVWSSLVATLIIRWQCVLLLLYVDLMGFHVELLGKRIRDVLHCHSMGGNCLPDGNCKQLCSLEFLLELKQSHMQLFELFGHFNDLFGWSILSIFVVMFMDGTVNVYWTQQVLAGAYEYVYLFASLSYALPSLALILAFCRCGEYCKWQHMLIGSHVRALAYTPAPQPSKEPAYTELLTEFTMQVEHNALAINAEGFMLIDNSLLMSMFAAMVTYLIVLMQFSAS
ncbi:putative gustatory receptor 39b [Drosophila obscura]|uniref:putative gustatory receptor 39b n=1 Tax=Drosophila obscura TaxID=7282 RepID=UPI001BB16802|nr:putative gustatory receptor 39b [Drosophila obscura]